MAAKSIGRSFSADKSSCYANPIPGIAVGFLVLSPTQSRGSIVINSADPLQPPVIDTGILSNQQDLITYQNLLMITLKNMNIALQQSIQLSTPIPRPYNSY